MKSISVYLGLLTVGVCGVDVQRGTRLSPPVSDANPKSTAGLQNHAISVQPLDDGDHFSILNNYGGWVNPEDLKAMPECIAQQDPTVWLDTMTKCTGKRCTRHFGVICSHHQWLTELSCLNTGFSQDVMQGYVPYCSRSVLSKAQLYGWIHSTTGRTWLVDVGDTNDVQSLSPASLEKGYAAVDIVQKAPSCLTNSPSAISSEFFHHVMGSCSFAHATKHTGNRNRPWEYNESLRSMTALDVETVGYNLTGHNIAYGNYFDKKCFCNFFHTNWENEPCSDMHRLDWTKQRLWVNATCGSAALPENWTLGLKTTEFSYIPTADWQWPACVADMPKRVTELTEKCAAQACQRDSDGYCKVTPAIERECVCRNIGYNSCGGSCHFFETRIDYVNWLDDLCGQVPDWHGLPDWKDELASPMTADLIPWQWVVKPSKTSKTHIRDEETETCPSNHWKMGSIIALNVATVVFFDLGIRSSKPQHRSSRVSPDMHIPISLLLGIILAAIHLCFNLVNAILVQQSTGFQDTPIFQLMLLWCSLPRPTFFVLFRLVMKPPFTRLSMSVALSSLVSEVLLQSISVYYMARTVRYGFLHDFYSGALENVEGGESAGLMYTGAILWLIIFVVVVLLGVAQLIRAYDLEQWVGAIYNHCSSTERELENTNSETTPLMGQERVQYGTIPGTRNWEAPMVSRDTLVVFLMCCVGVTLCLSFTQWLFWSGFIGLSSDEFCPPRIDILTVVWILSAYFGGSLVKMF